MARFSFIFASGSARGPVLAALAAAGLTLLLAAPPAAAQVVVNEIHYNSPGSPDVEFVELFNAGAAPVSLAGWTLLDDNDGNPPCPLSGTLQPGGFLIVAGNLAAFQAAYPGAGPLNPAALDGATPGSGFALGNTSDAVRLFDGTGAPVDAVFYEESGAWPAAADGDGPSLELRNPSIDNALATSWLASVTVGGTPGATNSRFEPNPPPEIGGVERDPALPAAGDPVRIAVAVTDDAPLAAVELQFDDGDGGGYQPLAMNDAGVDGDAVAGDDVWTATLAPRPEGTVVRYWTRATDAGNQTATSPPTAPAAWDGYTVGRVPPPLKIVEMLASNLSTNVDEFGQTDDWVELWNPGPAAVDLDGMFLTDDRGRPRRWQLPARVLAPGERVLVWCDVEPEQGALHASFALGRDGGEVALYDTVDGGNTEIDGFRYGPQNPDVSFGNRPDGAREREYLAGPTPGTSNDAAPLFSSLALNEFQAASQIPGAPDWVEVYNRGALTVGLSSWALSDDPAVPDRYVFPAGTFLSPGEYLVLDENDLGFALSADGEVLLLTSSNGLIGQDWWDFGPQLDDVSLARVPDGGPVRRFVAPPSPGSANACPTNLSDLPPVEGLRADGTAAWSWLPLDGAEAYDVVRGDLATLRASGPVDGAVEACVADDREDPAAWDPDDPAPGAGRFYLVRGVNRACRLGSWDAAGAPAQQGSRDPGFSAAAAGCP